MEFILLAVIVLQFGYMVYKDILATKEREALELKLMSKTVDDYKRVVEPVIEDRVKRPEEIRVPIEEASVEQILKASIQ